MPQICPHCHYIRKESDSAPDWQCPACERAYAKGTSEPAVAIRHGAPPPTANRRGVGRWLVLLAVLGMAIWLSRPIWSDSQASPGSAGATQPEVVLYATSWCGYCAAAREFFRKNGIEYIELDVEKSEIAREGHRALGGGGVPVIMVGEKVIHGFNEAELRDALKPWL